MKKSLAALAVFAIATVGLVIAPATAALADSGISGTITDFTTGLPIENATVQFSKPNGANNYFTNAAGQFTDHLTAGTYTVTISADGYATEYFDDTYSLSSAAVVTLTDSGSQIIDAALKPESTITGVITDDAGDPLAGAHVYVYGENQGWNYANGTDSGAGGAYTVGGLAPGHYQVYVWKSANDDLQDVWYQYGYSQPTSTQITLGSFGSTFAANVQLITGAEVTGTVTDSLGSPVTLQVFAEGAGVENEPSGSSNGGTYTIRGLHPQAYDISTHDPNHFFADSAAAPVTAVVGSPATANFIVTPELVSLDGFFDNVAPISGPTTVQAGKTYTWVLESNGNQNVYAILYSDPVYLGAGARGSDDLATLTLTIPASTPAGAHTFTYSSYTVGKESSSPSRQYFAIQVTAADPATPAALPATGMDSGIAGLLSLGLLSAGAVFMIGRRRLARA